MKIRFENIFKTYGSVHAVRDLSLTIEPGALHFLLGPSGCGKTTTLRLLAGLESPTSGHIFFGNKDVTSAPAAERGIGMVFQNYALWPHMTVRQNVLYGLKMRKLGKEATTERLDEALRTTHLLAYAERFPGQLSGGQQQRVALARALAIRPTVLLLDEPLSNLDAKLRLEMRDNIARIHAETGITTVYVTHDQKEALSMGTHVSVMRAGILVQTEPPRRLYRHPLTPFVAGFIGETNLIDGEWIDTLDSQGDSLAVVRTALGNLHAAVTSPGLKVGQKVTLSVRPESFRPPWDSRPSADANTLPLKVERRTYLGDCDQFSLTGPEGLKIKASTYDPPEDQDLTVGTTINFALDPRAILVLGREDDLRSGT